MCGPSAHPVGIAGYVCHALLPWGLGSDSSETSDLLCQLLVAGVRQSFAGRVPVSQPRFSMLIFRYQLQSLKSSLPMLSGKIEDMCVTIYPGIGYRVG